MNPEEIRLNDWQRIFLGESPAEFFIELIIRAAFLFLVLIVSMRLMGPRMAGQISRLEMVALFSLAAAIGVPLQAPDRGVLPSVVIAIVVVLIGKLVASLAFRHPRFESITQDETATLVSNGQVNIKAMKTTRMTFERVCARLRGEGIVQLGEIERMYFEASGSFTIIRKANPVPGLCIIPEFDHEFLHEHQFRTGVKVCHTCGFKQAQQKDPGGECENCGEKRWVDAMI